MKKEIKIKVVLKEISFYDLNGSISDAISVLQKIKETYSDRKVELDHDDEEGIFRVFYRRPENEFEQEDRERQEQRYIDYCLSMHQIKKEKK